MNVRTLLLGLAVVAAGCGGSVGEPTAARVPTDPSTPNTPSTPTTPTGPVVTGWVKGSVSGAGLTNPFQVFVPANYDPNKATPVILFMHGSGERGLDGVLQTTVGLGPVVKAQQATWPAITIFPQVGTNESARTGYIRVGMAALDTILKRYNVDLNRVYLTGLSAGGVYSFEMLHLNPGRFAAFVPIAANLCPLCITGNANATQAQSATQLAKEMPTMAYWQFQGDADPNIPVADARAISSAWKTVNPNARYTEYHGVGHDSWDPAYAEPTLFPWLFAQHR